MLKWLIFIGAGNKDVIKKEGVYHMIVITGPTGAGKTSVLEALYKKKIVPLYTYTTRPARENGNDFGTISISTEEFDTMLEDGEFIAYAIYHAIFGDVSYGIRKAPDEVDVTKTAVIGTYEYINGISLHAMHHDNGTYIVYLDMSDEDILNKYEESCDRPNAREDAKNRLERDRGKNDMLKSMAHLVIENKGYQCTPEELAATILTNYTGYVRRGWSSVESMVVENIGVN
jgi:guanylate kinase